VNARNPLDSRGPGARPDPFATEGDAGTIDLGAHLAEIGRARCIELLESTPIGRIGFTTAGGPMVLPVNFSWFEDSVVFRSLDGQKLSAAADGQVVCFEVDQWNAEDRSGWSVVVRGAARAVTQWAEREQLENLDLVPWARDAWRPRWVRIEPAEITGRLLR
jgi:uncharacterized protein